VNPVKGLTFHVYFPASSDKPGQNFPEDASIKDHGTETIMVVEDQKKVSEIIDKK